MILTPQQLVAGADFAFFGLRKPEMSLLALHGILADKNNKK